MLDLTPWQGKAVGIVGFGAKEGHATAEFLIRHGIRPVLFDRRPWEEWPDDERDYIRGLGVPVVFGPAYLDELTGVDVVFRNPAVPFLTPELQDFRKRGGILTSQTKFFFEHCPSGTVGVTGTKGKGTTATLTAEILKASGWNTYLTGNIGSTQPFELLEHLTERDWVVLELSSFQLQDLGQSPRVGVVLMVTEDHLDHHRSPTEYRTAKEAITRFQGPGSTAVYLLDNTESTRIGLLGAGQKLSFSRSNPAADCSVERGAVVLRKDGKALELIKTSALLLRGEHNWENVCAAVLAATAAGCKPDRIGETLGSFRGLEHRLELVAKKGGVTYYNDSFATNPDPTIAAIRSFSEPTVVILGGSSKGANFSELARAMVLRGTVKAAILVGDEADRIGKALRAAGATFPTSTGAQDMSAIVGQARELAAPGDVVLLSPACASFGMFKDYKDRGLQFKRAVLGLPN